MLGNKGTGREYRDGGCRGGQDQFKWEDVKADAYRESYLGHSLHAPVGRWQKGKDLLWYTKKNAGADGVNHAARLREQAADERRAEIAALKLMEEDMLPKVFQGNQCTHNKKHPFSSTVEIGSHQETPFVILQSFLDHVLPNSSLIYPERC